MRDRSIITLLLGVLITTTNLPIVPTQAQSAPSCQSQLLDDQLRRVPFPNQPLSDEIATNSVSRQLAELTEIAAAPDALDLNVQASLNQWLIGRLGVSHPDTPTPPQMELLLKELSLNSQPSEKNQLLQVLDQLATRIERLRDPQSKIGLMSALSRYYQKLSSSDRATSVLTRAIQFSLNQPNTRLRAADLSLLLTTASELKQTPKIASLLSSIESAFKPLLPPASPTEDVTQVTIPLTLAQAYIDQQPAKALQLIDQVAKFVPINQQNPDIARLYLQLNREDKAKPYLNTILKGYIPEDDPRYAALVAVYDNLKSPVAQQLFNKAWDSVQNPSVESRGEFVIRYFEAGGNPDRIAKVLLTSSPELRVQYLLMVAGIYRQRNQPQKSDEALAQAGGLTPIAQFVQAVQQLQNNQDGTSAIAQAIELGYLPEASIAFRQLASLSVIAANPYNTISLAQATNSLEAIEPTIQRLSKTNPMLRTDLLQQLAIAYAQKQNPNQATSIAAQIPLQDADLTRSPQIETLTQIATILAQAGLQYPTQNVFALTLKSVQKISALHIRATAYGALARAYTKIGQREAAETARQNAVKWAKKIQVDPNTGITTNYVLSLVSQQFLNQNQITAAWKTLQEIPQDAYKETNIDNLVISAIQFGQLNIAQQAAQLIYTYQTPEAFSQIAPSIAQAYLSRNRDQDAIAILDRATKILNSQKKRSIDTLTQVIKLYAQLNRIDAARQLLANYPTSSAQISANLRKQELQQYVNCYAQRSRS